MILKNAMQIYYMKTIFCHCTR